MKSEPGFPARCGISFGTAVSAAIWCAVGITAEGSRLTSAAVVPGVAALAAVADAAAPATATPARNFRRLTSGRESFRAIAYFPEKVIAAAPGDSLELFDRIFAPASTKGCGRVLTRDMFAPRMAAPRLENCCQIEANFN